MRRQPYIAFCWATCSIVLLVVSSTTSAAPIVFSYDGSSPPHAPSSDTGHTYQYDANGNLIAMSDSQSSTSLEHADFNKIKSVQTGTAVTHYLYDNQGRIVGKVVGNTLVERYFGSIEFQHETRKRFYTWGSTRVAEREEISGGLPTFFHQDHLGSVATATNATGTTSLRSKYYEFGALQEQHSLGTSTPYAYTDMPLEPETNFYDYNARRYGSKYLHFVSADSIIPYPTDPQSFNRYSYVRNNPVNRIDPTGHNDYETDGLIGGISVAVEWSNEWSGKAFDYYYMSGSINNIPKTVPF